MREVTFSLDSLNSASLLRGLPTPWPIQSWPGWAHVQASPAAVLRDTRLKHLTLPVRDALGLGQPCHLSQCSMPARGRLLGWVGQTRDSNVPTPTTEYMTQYKCLHYIQCGMFGGWVGSASAWEGHGGLSRGRYLVAVCMVCGAEVRRQGEH